MRIRGRFEKLWIAAVPIAYLALIQLVFAPADPSQRTGDEPASLGVRIGLVLIVVGVGAAVVGLVAYWTRNFGMNEVYGATATDAATPHHESGGGAPLPTRWVSDRELLAMATTAFTPPAGVAPWQGLVLLREEINYRTADAYIAELVFGGALVIDDSEPDRRALVEGPRFDDAPEPVRAWMNKMLGREGRAELTRFDGHFATAIAELGGFFTSDIAASGWWRPGSGPKLRATHRIGSRAGRVFNTMFNIWFGFFATLGCLFLLTLLSGVARSPLKLAVVTLAVSPIAAVITRFLNRTARTAEGSALTLQVESFRRFLEMSETKRVEHGWSRRMIREYATWAVAIADADALVPELVRAGIVRITDARSILSAIEIVSIDDSD